MALQVIKARVQTQANFCLFPRPSHPVPAPQLALGTHLASAGPMAAAVEAELGRGLPWRPGPAANPRLTPLRVASLEGLEWT